VLVGHVVGDDVDDRAQAQPAGLGDERLGLGQRAELGVDRPVVGDVVAAVGPGREVPGVEPEGVDAEVAEVRETVADAGQVADPVAVPVGEAPHVHLVHRGSTPPVVTHVPPFGGPAPPGVNVNYRLIFRKSWTGFRRITIARQR
jgi:hypothetical protein